MGLGYLAVPVVAALIADRRSTEFEIVSKPVLSPLNFPPDWQKILLDQIDVELKARK
jgi:hypothetical protein